VWGNQGSVTGTRVEKMGQREWETHILPGEVGTESPCGGGKKKKLSSRSERSAMGKVACKKGTYRGGGRTVKDAKSGEEWVSVYERRRKSREGQGQKASSKKTRQEKGVGSVLWGV